MQQLQDRKETKKYRLTKTETKKVCRDFHVKWIGKAALCTFCKSTGDLHSGADRQSAGNERDSKAGDPALPHGSLCDPQKRFWILLPRLAKVSSVSPSRGRRVPLLHGREMVLLLCDQKYHPVPLLREAGKSGLPRPPWMHLPTPFSGNILICPLLCAII